MRKCLPSGIALFTLILCTSCYSEIKEMNEPDLITASQVEIKVKAGIKPITRVSNNLFELEDQIGLYIFTGENKELYLDNACYEYSKGNVFRALDEAFYPKDKTESSVYAYYPYHGHKKISESTISTTIKTDQSTTKSLSESDFLVAYKPEVKTSKKALELIFQHKLAKLNLAIKIAAPYTATDLLKIKPTLRLLNFSTQAEYNFSNDIFNNPTENKSIIPYMQWSVKDDKLVGAEAIILPTDNLSSQKVQITVENVVYECNLPDNLNIKSGTVNEVVLMFTPAVGVEVKEVESDITEWNNGEQTHINPQPLLEAISVSSFSFEKSNVINLINAEGLIRAKITKELLKNKDFEASATIIYPTSTINEGVILDIDHPNKDAYVAGAIKWIGSDFQITPSNKPYINYIFINEQGAVVFDEPVNPEIITIKHDHIYDNRADEIINYPIVKIANLLWMRSNLSTKYFADGSQLASNKNGIVSTPGFAIYDEAPSEKIYNAGVPKSKDICPKGWRLPTLEEAKTLIKYTNNQTKYLIHPSGYLNSSVEMPKEVNLSNFNHIKAGGYGKMGYNKEISAYWLKDSTSQSMFSVTSGSYNIVESKEIEDSPRFISIRCVKSGF